jgi:hypothetical protein
MSLFSLSFLLAAGGSGCGKSVTALSGPDGAASGSGGGGATTGSGGGGGNTYDGPLLGIDASKIPIGQTQCSDGIDNDGDGLIDYADPECTSPADNDESSFATGIPGDNVDPCKQDCFFDGNSGMGDDGCQWELKCDPANPGQYVGCPYDPSYKNCPGAQSQKCIDNCRKYTPNGCDCFGCCDIPGVGSLLLAATCSAAKFNDPVACPRCTQNTSCNNTCEHCEICVGKPTLPADCGPVVADGGNPGPDAGGYVPVCDNGQVACGPGGVDPTACPAGTGCVTGCCIPIVP